MLRTLIVVLALIAAVPTSRGQDAPAFPTRTVRLIVPAAPGGRSMRWRAISPTRSGPPGPRPWWWRTSRRRQQHRRHLCGSVASGRHTLLLISDSITVNPSLYPNLDKDPLRQFEPIAVVVTAPQLLIARPDLDVSKLGDFIDLAKTRNPPFNIGSAGAGTISHLTQVLLDLRIGAHSSHIPFRGAAPAVTAVLGKHVDAAWVMPAPVLPYVASGQVKALAVTSAARDPRLPDVPTVEESGLADFQIINWQGLFAPAHTPKPVIDQIARAVSEVLNRPEVKSRMQTIGFEARGDGPAVAADLVRTNVARWSALVAKAGITTGHE